MYNAFAQLCEQVLRIPHEPEPPPGDEAKTRIFLAAPNYYKYLLVMWGLRTAASLLAIVFVFVLPLIGLFAGRSRVDEGWIVLFLVLEGIGLVVALIGAVLSLALVRLNFEKRWYVVTDRSLRVREGVFQVKEATVTFANIQNISISQGPIQRLLGIADLRVDTAGGGGGGGGAHGHHGMASMHTVWFRGVNNANEIKELMQQRLRQLKDSGLGDHEELAEQAKLEVETSLLATLREVLAEAEALRLATGRRFGA